MLIYDSFPLAQICLFFPQENATMQIVGFECFHSLGVKMGAAPKIPGVGKGAFPGDTLPAQDPKTPSLPNMGGFIPSIPAGAGAGWGQGVAGALSTVCGHSWRTRACRWSS